MHSGCAHRTTPRAGMLCTWDSEAGDAGRQQEKGWPAAQREKRVLLVHGSGVRATERRSPRSSSPPLSGAAAAEQRKSSSDDPSCQIIAEMWLVSPAGIEDDPSNL